MTNDEQLEKWLNGEPVHNDTTGECTPDFSCCKPHLLADEKTRRMYYNAEKNSDQTSKMLILTYFIAKLLASQRCPTEVNISFH